MDYITWAKNVDVKQLVEFLEKTNDDYHNKGESDISDDVFDTLLLILKEKNPNHPFLKVIGSDVKGKKVKLPFWLGSMEKIKDAKKLAQWLKKNKANEYVISDKLDGMSALYYEDKLYTRGNGSEGHNISHLLKYLKLPKIDKNIAVRGEIIAKKSTGFNRNKIVGLVGSKHKTVPEDILKFVAYEVILSKDTIQESCSNQIKLLKKNFEVVFSTVTPILNFEGLVEILRDRKANSLYEIDGIIVTSNKLYVRNTSGNPSYSIAFKQNVTSYPTQVKRVEWNISKDGYLIPRVEYEPIKIGDTTLNFASGFNAKFIIDNNIGPGSIIDVIRSGDVIPFIQYVLKSTIAQLPENVKYKWDKTKTHFILTEKSETLTLLKRMTHFTKTIGVKFCDEAIISKLVENGIDSIYKLKTLTVNDLIKIDGFQEKSAIKLISQLQEKLSCLDLLTAMVASNCFGHGLAEKKLKKIIDVYPDILTKTRTVDELKGIDGFSDTLSVKFLDNLPEFKKWIEINKFTIKNPIEKKNKKKHLKGSKIVFSGFRDKDLEKEIESLGGEISSSVSKHTTTVIIKDINSTSSKIIEAKKLNINIINVIDFKKYLSQL